MAGGASFVAVWFDLVRWGLLMQVSTGEAWWSMVRCGALWFVNAGQARCVFVRSGRVRQVWHVVVRLGSVVYVVVK